jgi:hypothetical protein
MILIVYLLQLNLMIVFDIINIYTYDRFHTSKKLLKQQPQPPAST